MLFSLEAEAVLAVRPPLLQGLSRKRQRKAARLSWSMGASKAFSSTQQKIIEHRSRRAQEHKRMEHGEQWNMRRGT